MVACAIARKVPSAVDDVLVWAREEEEAGAVMARGGYAVLGLRVRAWAREGDGGGR
jgi:hypothetical protein